MSLKFNSVEDAYTVVDTVDNVAHGIISELEYDRHIHAAYLIRAYLQLVESTTCPDIVNGFMKADSDGRQAEIEMRDRLRDRWRTLELARVHAMRHVCPYCGADPEVPCTTDRGIRTHHHKSRVNLTDAMLSN